MTNNPLDRELMTPAVLREWAEALRSGKYQQTKGVLRRRANDGSLYCCLGVLCDLRAPDQWDETSYVHIAAGCSAGIGNGGDAGAWIVRLALKHPHCAVTDANISLVGLNDRLGADFNYIALVIEQAAEVMEREAN